GTGLTPLFPLFGMDTTALAREMVDSGLRARITCIDPKALDRSFAGREFNSFAYAGPMFPHSIPVVGGEIVERDGFIFADVLLADAGFERHASARDLIERQQDSGS